MRESTIERKTAKYAESKGVSTYKFTSPSRRAVPDRWFFFDGFGLLVEFKAPGKKPTKAQINEHKKLKAVKVRTFVIDSVDEGVKLIDLFILGEAYSVKAF